MVPAISPSLPAIFPFLMIFSGLSSELRAAQGSNADSFARSF